MKIETYLNYNGNCQEAFRFYEKHLGGKISFLMTYGEMPMPPGTPNPHPGMEKSILHLSFDIAGTRIMACDQPPPHDKPIQGAWICIKPGSVAEVERIYQVLSDGAEIVMKLDQTFFAEKFAMLRDRFGTPWMIIHERPMS